MCASVYSNRSQITSKCGKNKELAHELQASVSLMFIPHFDVFCDLLLNRPMATWNLFGLYNDQKGKKTDTHTHLIPLDYSTIFGSLVPNSTFCLCFLLIFSLNNLLVCSFFEKFFNVFSCSKQNNGENILQNSSVSRSHDT